MNKRYASVDRSKEIKSKREMNTMFQHRNLILNINDFDINNIFNQTKLSALKTINHKSVKPKKLPVINKQFTSSQFCDINTKTSDMSTEINNNEKNNILKTNANQDLNDDYCYKIIINSDFRDKSSFNNSKLISPNRTIKPIIKIPNVITNDENRKIKYPPILSSERLCPKNNTDKNSINILKKIKSIRNRNLKIKNNKNLLFSTKLNSLSIPDNIAYVSKYENFVFDANKILNTHNFKDNDLSINDNMKAFVSKNKELCLDNLLINIINKENKNLKENFEIRKKNVENFEKTITKDEKDFELNSMKQKKLYYKTNELLTKIHGENSNLIKLYYELISKTKVLEDEIFKMVEQIESLRIYAKFVTKILGGNDKLFDGELIPDYENTNKPDINLLIKKVYDKYGNLLSNRKLSMTANTYYTINNEEKNNNNVDLNNPDEDTIEEEVDIDLLNDPIFMIRKFKDMEDKILNYVDKQDIFLKYANKEYYSNEQTLKDLRLRIVKLEKELEYSKKNLIDFKNMIYGNNFKEDENKEYYNLTKELCQYIFENIGNNSKKFQNNIDIFELHDDVTKCMNLLFKNEKDVNEYINNLEINEKKDKKFFNEVMNQRREEIKFSHQNKNRENLNVVDNTKANKVHQKFYKIIIKSKRSEPPYYKMKKEVVIKEDKNDIIRKENLELITYK